MVDEVQNRQLTTNVAALTYTTVLAVVPLLALILALGRGFGLEQFIETQLRANLNVQEHVIDQLMTFANSYISKTHDDWIIGVSLVFLFFTLVSLVNNIEEKVNALWGIRTSRSLLSFSLSYLGLIVFLIISLFLLSGVWLAVLRLLNYLPQYDLVQATTPFLLFLVKWAASAGIFVMMYKYVPVTRVQWSAVLVPGALAGLLFCLVQQFYIQGQVFLTTYNTVYGSFAVLPLLMVWIYATWLICLGGVVLCQAIQYVREVDGAEVEQLATPARDVVALLLMRRIGEAFVADQSPYTLDGLCRSLQLSSVLVHAELQRLVAAGLVFACDDAATDETHYRVGTDLHQMSIAQFWARLDGHGTPLELDHLQPEWGEIAAIRAQLAYGIDGQQPLISPHQTKTNGETAL